MREIIDALFAAFPQAKIAAATGWPITTICSWPSTGNVPEYRRKEILRAAYGEGVKLPESVIDYLDPNREVSETYPNSPGFRDTDTSRAAADSVAHDAPALQALVINALRHAGDGGLTADECAARLGLNLLSIRPRVTELKAKGQVKDSGERRRNASGRRAIVWILVPKEEADA